MGIFWGLVWRSVVFLPFAFVYLVLLCGAYVAWVVFPVVVLFCLWSSDWWGALEFTSAWVAVCFALRWWWRRELLGNYWGAL